MQTRLLALWIATGCASVSVDAGAPPAATLSPEGKADIYGEDGRRFIEDPGVAPWMQRLAQSATVAADNIAADGSVAFPSATTRETGRFCPEERLVDEPSVATCTVSSSLRTLS